MQSMTQTHTSPLSGATRTIATPGTRWKFTGSWPNLWGTDRAAAEAFLAQLNGRAGRFYFSPPEYYYPKGTARTCTVNGGGQTGTILNVTMNAFTTLLRGDFIEVNGELKRLTASTTADSGGGASLSFGPPLRDSPSSGSSVILTAPKATFMLMDDLAGVTVGPGGYADFTIDAVETFL